MISLRLVSSLVALLFSLYFFYHNEYNESHSDEKLTAESWSTIIENSGQTFRRVALGVNGNVDLIVKATELLNNLDITPAAARDHASLNSFEQLQETFQYFFSRGAAVERFFASFKSFLLLTDEAANLEDAQWSVGGNAALMATRIATSFPGTEVQLVAPIGPRLKDLLDRRINIPGFSEMPEDEIHLIMEYSAGETWGPAVAPTANRFITSSDGTNSMLSHMEALFSSFQKFQPDLIIWSGLHLLEVQEEKIWKERLENFVSAVHSHGMKDDTPMHLELASMANPMLVINILEKIFPHVNSIGLNEQELAFISFAGGGPHFDLLEQQKTGGQPPIHKVVDILVWLLRKYGNSLEKPGNKLSRIHFHSLTYHIIASAEEVWRHTESSLVAGARIAGLQACDVSDFSLDKFELRIPQYLKMTSSGKFSEPLEYTGSSPVVAFNMKGYAIHFTPVLVCKLPKKTVGLGDSISSSALMHTSYVRLWHREANFRSRLKDN